MRRRRRNLNPPSLMLEKKTILTIIGFGGLTLSLLLAISLFTSTGLLLSLKSYFYNFFGIGIILMPIIIIIASLPLLSVKSRFSKINVIFGATAALLSILGITAAASESASGVFGATLWSVFKSLVTPVGAFFVLFFTFLVSVVITFNTSLDQALSTIVRIYRAIGGFFKTVKVKIFGLGKPHFVTQTSGGGQRNLKQAHA